MGNCTKCKTKIGFFSTTYACDEEGCTSKPALCLDCYDKCSDEVLAECETCGGCFCPQHFDNHECDEDEETCEECGELLEDCTCEDEEDKEDEEMVDEELVTYSKDKNFAYLFTESDCTALAELEIVVQLYADGYKYVGLINDRYVLFKKEIIPPKDTNGY